MIKNFTLLALLMLMKSVLFAQINQHNPSTVYVNLLDPSKAVMDGIGAVYGKQYSDCVDNVDALKLWNSEIENVALIRHDTALAIEFRHIPKFTDTLFLRLYLRQHPYSLQIFSVSLPKEFPGRAWIVDKYLNTKTEIDLSKTTLYDFVPRTDTNSYRNRFMLVFNKALVQKPQSVEKLSNQNNPVSTGVSNSLATSVTGISLQPNPSSDSKNVFVRFENADKGAYEIKLYNINGKQLGVEKIEYYGGKVTYALPVTSTLHAGVYITAISNLTTTETSVLKLVISK